MARLLTILSLILALLLFPPATLALISNNAVPGDATYPIKRGLEDVIFSVASVNPVTKAWFSAARSDRRFQELSILVTQGKQATKTINELVDQTKITASEIAQVTDESQKAKLVEQLSQSIEKYDQGLKDLSSSKPKETVTPAETATPVPSVVSSLPPQPTVQPPTPSPTPIQPWQSNRPSFSPTPRSSVTPTPRPTSSPTSTPKPTSTPIPAPSPTPAPGQPPSDCDQIKDDIERARCELEKIRNGLGVSSTRLSPRILKTTPSPTPKPTSKEDKNLTPEVDTDKIKSEKH